MFKNMTTNLMVNSVEQSIAFYRDKLGFTVETSVPGENGELLFAILSKDSASLMLQEKTSLISEYPMLDTPDIRPSITLYTTVDDLDALYTAVSGIHPVCTKPHVSAYGAKEFAVTDPDGYVLTFAQAY